MNFVPNPSHLQVIPDTGAEVTIVGTKYLSHLKIKQSWLNPPQHNLKHVAGGNISVIGSCYLSFNVHSQTTIEEVYFVDNIPHIFLSLIACKELKLISSDSPYKPVEQAVDTACKELKLISSDFPYKPVEQAVDTACKELKLISSDYPYKPVEQAVGTEEQEDPGTSFLNEGIDEGQSGITQLVSSTMGKLNDKWETNQLCSFQPLSIPEMLPYIAVDQNIPLFNHYRYQKSYHMIAVDQNIPLFNLYRYQKSYHMMPLIRIYPFSTITDTRKVTI